VLTAVDPLPRTPRRILVAGTSGAGKTTLAKRVAEVAGVPHVEMDALHHGPGWTPRADFMADVAAFAAEPAWVTEWQYGAARPLLLDRADLLVWLDHPRSTVMGRVVRRTLSRRLHRTRLWNGNIEPPLATILTDPDHIVRWAWRTHPGQAARARAAAAARQDLAVVRLTDQHGVDAWVGGPLQHAVRRPPDPR
jgi:adenylate kinase family enzyme